MLSTYTPFSIQNASKTIWPETGNPAEINGTVDSCSSTFVINKVTELKHLSSTKLRPIWEAGGAWFLRSKSRLFFMFTLLWRTGNRGRRAGSKNMASMKHWEVISCLRADCLFTDIQLTITNWYSTQWTEI